MWGVFYMLSYLGNFRIPNANIQPLGDWFIAARHWQSSKFSHKRSDPLGRKECMNFSRSKHSAKTNYRGFQSAANHIEFVNARFLIFYWNFAVSGKCSTSCVDYSCLEAASIVNPLTRETHNEPEGFTDNLESFQDTKRIVLPRSCRRIWAY